MNDNQKKIDYVREQLTRASSRAHAYAYDASGKQRAKRNCFVLLDKYLRDFDSGRNRQSRWLAISGLRGTGKTTLMAQLYLDLNVPPQRKLFISIDHAVQLLSSNITELIGMYEEELGQSLEAITEPVYLFLDEVQYDSSWAIALKSLYDRTPNVFIMSTGSSALELNTNPDTARRVITETLLPMSFTEYQKINSDTFEIRGLGLELRNAIKNADTAKDVYDVFSVNTGKVTEYWSRVDSTEINKYLQYGTLPFMAALGNPALAFDQLERSIDRIIGGDVLAIGQFGADITARIPQVLYSIADSDVTSVNSLSNTLKIPRPTLTRILDALQKAEVLYKLEPATASHTSQIRQPDKYMFTTPAIRAMYFTLTGSTRASQQVMGHLLEDTVVMYLRRIFGERSLTNAINHNNAAGSADFMVTRGHKQYVIETGLGRKDSKQILATNARDDRIGIVISNGELSLDAENNIVTVPIRQFMLV